MITKRLILAVLLPAALPAQQPANTILTPIYLPGPSSPDSAGPATPRRSVDNSGMSIHTAPGVRLGAILSATHTADMTPNESWMTNSVGLGLDYFAPGNPRPVLIYDLEADYEVTRLLFWQFQGTGGAGTEPGNGAREIKVRFSTEAAGPLVFSGAQIPFTLFDLNTLGGVNGTQQRFLLTPITARYLEVKITDNFFGVGMLAGGERVGLGEFRVGVLNDPAIAVSPGFDVCARTPPNTFAIPITNSASLGGSNLNIFNIRVVGPDAALFSIAPWGPPLSIAPQATYNLSVTYSPNKNGCSVEGGVLIESDGDSDDDTIVDLGDATATAPCPPLVFFVNYPIVIGPFPKGVGPQPFTVDIWCTGYCGPADIGSVVFGDSQFTNAESLPVSVNEGDTRDLPCIFDPPTTPGAITTNVVVSGTSWSETMSVETEILGDPEVSIPDPTVFASSTGEVTGQSISFEITTQAGEVTLDDPSTNAFPTPELPSALSVGSWPATPIGAGTETAELILNTGPWEFGSYPAVITGEAPDGTGGTKPFQFTLDIRVIPPLELTIGNLTGTEVDVEVEVSNVASGLTFHLRGSTDGKTFTPLSVGREIEGDTTVTIPVSGTAMMLIQAYHGPADP